MPQGPSLLRLGVSIADKITRGLHFQTQVSFAKMVLSGDGYGTKTFPTTVLLSAIVEWKSVQLRTQSGVLNVIRPSLLFLNVAEIVAATNGEGISEEDRITLPDGTTGPTSNLGGFMDAGTGHPIATEVVIG